MENYSAAVNKARQQSQTFWQCVKHEEKCSPKL